MKHRLKLNNSGDTIIEVLIVLAILSFAFAMSLATANRGLGQSRNAEEHSEALGTLVSQVEQLRTAVGAQVSSLPTNPSKSFCMQGATTPVIFSGAVPSSADQETNYNEYPAACKFSAAGGAFNYNESITYEPNGSSSQDNLAYYDVRIRWDGAGTLGKQQVEFTYKIHPLSAAASSGTQLSGTSPQIQVVVKKIPPKDVPNTQDASPNCQGSATGVFTTNITLTDSTDPSQPAQSQDSTAIFNVSQFHSYKITMTVPGSYQVCSANPTTQGVPQGQVYEVDEVVSPICSAQSYTPPPTQHPYQHPYEHYHTVYWWAHQGGNHGDGTGDYPPNSTPYAYWAVPSTAQFTDPSTVPVGTIGYQIINTIKNPVSWYYNTFTSTAGQHDDGYYADSGTSGPGWYADSGTGGPGWYSDPSYTIYVCPSP